MSPEEPGRSQLSVLDASAVLALLHGEPGGEVVEGLLGTSAIGRPAVTTDKVWGDLNLGIEVRIVR